MEYLINDAIERFSDKLFRKLIDIERKLESLNKKLENQNEKIEKLERNMLEVSIIVSGSHLSSNTSSSRMEDID